MPDLTGIATIKEQNMRYFTFLLLFSLCLSVFAQKKMTIRNSETGEDMTITVPDGLVITSGIEGEDGDFVVTDTLYADNGEPCIVDTVACDTVESDFLFRQTDYTTWHSNIKQGESTLKWLLHYTNHGFWVLWTRLMLSLVSTKMSRRLWLS